MIYEVHKTIREYNDITYINKVLNNIEYSIFSVFEQLYPNSTHTRWNTAWQFKIYCYDDSNEHKYDVNVAISYNIFYDTYTVRLHLLDNNYYNVNNIFLEFTAEEVLTKIDTKEITKIIKDTINNY